MTEDIKEVLAQELFGGIYEGQKSSPDAISERT